MTAVGLPTAPRRVRRIIRKFDPWTVLKVSLVLTAIAALGLVLVAVTLWAIVNRLGIPGALERAAQRVSLIAPDETLLQSGSVYLRGTLLAAAGWMMMVTGLLTSAAIVYNLIAEVAGGVEFTVYEDTPVDPAYAADQLSAG